MLLSLTLIAVLMILYGLFGEILKFDTDDIVIDVCSDIIDDFTDFSCTATFVEGFIFLIWRISWIACGIGVAIFAWKDVFISYLLFCPLITFAVTALVIPFIILTILGILAYVIIWKGVLSPTFYKCKMIAKKIKSLFIRKSR